LFYLHRVHTSESNPILLLICCEVRWFLPLWSWYWWSLFRFIVRIGSICFEVRILFSSFRLHFWVCCNILHFLVWSCWLPIRNFSLLHLYQLKNVWAPLTIRRLLIFAVRILHSWP
jgi:hypothetical protein